MVVVVLVAMMAVVLLEWRTVMGWMDGGIGKRCVLYWK